MTTRDDLDNIRSEIEHLRSDLRATRRVDEERVWFLLQRASAMLDGARGGPLEPTFHVIYGLLDAVWNTVRHQDLMHSAARSRRAAGG
jgi:hypothetical protein